jgi:hypothetical protein
VHDGYQTFGRDHQSIQLRHFSTPVIYGMSIPFLGIPKPLSVAAHLSDERVAAREVHRSVLVAALCFADIGLEDARRRLKV